MHCGGSKLCLLLVHTPSLFFPIQPKSAEHILGALDSGNRNRTQHPTDMNATSSRSHAVLQVFQSSLRKQHKESIINKRMNLNKKLDCKLFLLFTYCNFRWAVTGTFEILFYFFYQIPCFLFVVVVVLGDLMTLCVRHQNRAAEFFFPVNLV